MKALEITKTVIRCLLGALFIATAVLKLLSIDNFEIYIYSFELFSFAMSAVVARLVIMAEIVLGLLLISKVYYKLTWWLTFAMLLGFTLFLAYVAAFRQDSNCHCFGDFVELDPLASIGKNVVTLLLLFFIRKEGDASLSAKRKKVSAVIICGVAAIVTFAVFPPDALYNKFVSKHDHFNEHVFQKARQDSSLMTTLDSVRWIEAEDTVLFATQLADLQIDSGNYLVGVMASGCKYCKLGSRKVNTIFKRNDISPSKFKIFVWTNGTPMLASFLKETETYPYEVRVISPYLAVDLVDGRFPTFALMQNGKVVRAFDVHGIDERELVDLLKE